MAVSCGPARFGRTAALMVVLFALAGCGSASVTAGSPAAIVTRSCGTATSLPPAKFGHVVWIVMENHGYTETVNARGTSFTSRLARHCGLATNYYAVAHPSVPNYLALTSGSTHGISADVAPPTPLLGGADIFGQVASWKALEDSMPTPCDHVDADLFVAKHDPPLYFADLATTCTQNDVPLTVPPDLSAEFTFITPNLCHDTHNCSVASGDRWLAAVVPALLATPQYQSGTTAVFITWDEDDTGSDNHVTTIVVSPYTRAHTVDATRYDHYSLLRTTEEMLGITAYAGAAAQAVSMRAGFNLAP